MGHKFITEMHITSKRISELSSEAGVKLAEGEPEGRHERRTKKSNQNRRSAFGGLNMECNLEFLRILLMFLEKVCDPFFCLWFCFNFFSELCDVHFLADQADHWARLGAQAYQLVAVQERFGTEVFAF